VRREGLSGIKTKISGKDACCSHGRKGIPLRYAREGGIFEAEGVVNCEKRTPKKAARREKETRLAERTREGTGDGDGGHMDEPHPISRGEELGPEGDSR